ncbi:dienelactone hydrolase family protein [Streptomyces bathyalis]|uniref:dienelactone hydrolase family protein n=1 Tax=Streptomyces bathyalis TaxID=2710756 RepID=UPI0018D0B4F1|nr:dienelactone hydrolase family protein [Streptomyces bathyalis]
MEITSLDLDIPAPDGTADAFAAFPAEGGRHPGVLLYMDVIGLRPVIRGLAMKLASHGYYVLAPNVFYRHGRAPLFPLPDMREPEARDAFIAKVRPVMADHTPDKSVPDSGAYLDFLTQQEQVSPGAVGVTGYCMGAMLALRTASAHPGTVAAAAGFHGARLATDAADSPHLDVGSVTAELHFGHAENDDAMPPKDIARLDEALDAAGVRYTSEVYPGPHGFTMSDTSAYSPVALERHWERLLPLLRRNLKGGT